MLSNEIIRFLIISEIADFVQKSKYNVHYSIQLK